MGSSFFFACFYGCANIEPQIVPSLVGEGHFEVEKIVVDGTKVVVDETVGEKEWEIILHL